MTLSAVVLALAIGGLMGLLGGGGSLLAVPAFTLLLDLTPKGAIVTSLLVVGSAALVGTIGAWVRGVLNLRVGMMVGMSAMVGAVAGGVAGARMPDQLQLSVLAVVMFLAAGLLWLRSPEPSAPLPRAVAPQLIMTGLGVGALTGAIGVGGGFLMVPALVAASGLSMTEAGSVSLLSMTLSTAAALPAYSTGTIDWAYIGPFAGIAAAAALGGGAMAVRVPQRILQRAFAIFLVILGSYLLFGA